MKASPIGVGRNLPFFVDAPSDKDTDGLVVGRGMKAYDPKVTSPWDVAGVLPEDNVAPQRKVFLVTGIMTTASMQYEEAKALANTTKSEVIAIRNATEGLVHDIFQSIQDKFNLGENPAVDTTVQVILEGLERGETINLAAHSQGAIIVSRAIQVVEKQLLSQGKTQQQVDRLLDTVHVFTAGGASWTFKSGPHYVHLSNTKDSVPRLAGQLFPLTQPGANAQRFSFSEKKDPTGLLPPWWHGVENLFARYLDNTVHGLRQVYLTKVEQTGIKIF